MYCNFADEGGLYGWTGRFLEIDEILRNKGLVIVIPAFYIVDRKLTSSTWRNMSI